MDNPGSSNSAGKLVLIVDDDKDIRDLMADIVRKEGFTVETAADGEEALAKARSISPDVILLDLMLPKYGGFEILHDLQEEETVNIPIVIMTGHYLDPSTADMIRRESNVLDFIEKPIKTEVLMPLLRRRPPRQPSRM